MVARTRLKHVGTVWNKKDALSNIRFWKKLGYMTDIKPLPEKIGYKIYVKIK